MESGYGDSQGSPEHPSAKAPRNAGKTGAGPDNTAAAISRNTRIQHLAGTPPGGFMSWLEHHRKSELLASDAETARHQDNDNRARELYKKAAEA